MEYLSKFMNSLISNQNVSIYVLSLHKQSKYGAHDLALARRSSSSELHARTLQLEMSLPNQMGFPTPTTDENRMWSCRLGIIESLARWVANNLRKPNRTWSKNWQKGEQYVYSNIIIGKMAHPDDTEDEPLTFLPYFDQSMSEHLR